MGETTSDDLTSGDFHERAVNHELPGWARIFFTALAGLAERSPRITLALRRKKSAPLRERLAMIALAQA